MRWRRLPVSLAGMAEARDLSLAYFMGPKHPMNAGLMMPFGEELAEATNGALTVQQFPGGALNSVPPKQYSILLDGVADIVFTLPGYTADAFPKTNVVGLPGVCDSALDCTEALQRARSELEKEYAAKVLAIWANAPPVLITRNKPVTTLADLEGMKVRVTSKGDVPFVEALGASCRGAAGDCHQSEPRERRDRRHHDRSFGDWVLQAPRARQLCDVVVPGLRLGFRVADEPRCLRRLAGGGEGGHRPGVGR